MAQNMDSVSLDVESEVNSKDKSGNSIFNKQLGDGKGISIDSTGKASKARLKSHDAVPKTTFQPIAAPNKLNAMKYSADELKNRKRLIYEDLLRIFVASRVPVTLWGPAGSGKTRSVEAMAQEVDEDGTNYNVITVQPSTEDPQTIHGMMTLTEDPRYGHTIMERSIPSPADQAFKAFQNQDALTIMFLDEMTTCSVSQQNALLGMLTHGQYGSMNIHNYTTFVMAANPENTVSTVNPLGEQVLNRGAHLPWYSDVDHFLSKWRTGFNDKRKAPSPRTNEFLTKLLKSEDSTFRCDPDKDEDDRWDIDNLVPYEDMATSERVSVAIANAYDIVNNKLKNSPYSIRALYIEEAVKALVGPKYAENAAKIEWDIESHAGTEPSLNAVSEHKIDSNTTYEELLDLLGDSLHRSHEQLMREDEETELAETFKREIFADGGFSSNRYLAMLIWLATSPSKTTRKGAIPIVSEVVVKVISEYRAQISKDMILPSFINPEIKDEIGQWWGSVREKIESK